MSSRNIRTLAILATCIAGATNVYAGGPDLFSDSYRPAPPRSDFERMINRPPPSMPSATHNHQVTPLPDPRNPGVVVEGRFGGTGYRFEGQQHSGFKLNVNRQFR